jgi:hypothetical protein
MQFPLFYLLIVRKEKEKKYIFIEIHLKKIIHLKLSAYN